MEKNHFTVEFLATSLVGKLDRKNIFPPLFNDPELFVASIESKAKKPPNSFLICRLNVSKEANKSGNHNMRTISKAASILWNGATPQEKNVYKKLAERVYEIYALRYSLISLSSEVESTELQKVPSLSLTQPPISVPSPTAITLETFPPIIYNYYITSCDNSDDPFFYNDNDNQNEHFYFLPYYNYNEYNNL
ncbi:unnamed protein product [Rhizophagus irregularis]|uniref:MATA-HMG n=2 Tax=Rhizophagus irregularis TaxID=588596 RepID=A0A915ZZ76_9GLOM|nr:unnamed protein product [Rhizophagus irregularis]CAB5183208.1 unnamed protein product [Rhizophagus irregularis]CAB5394629.1 unnamed protein product [Rhizophagus irregularis]